ncbi:MAG: hypothetical protein JSW34_08280 [Candidatus Zixiibacteriota bacterium]|nr:MAG: hypothetical protein JSW34_08280 [candidate division Zixibacteria bacterium]
MRKLLSIVLLAVLVVSFAVSAMVSQVEAKPLPGVCYLACNRTTYQLFECCPYTQHGDEVVFRCKHVGWCYPG